MRSKNYRHPDKSKNTPELYVPLFSPFSIGKILP